MVQTSTIKKAFKTVFYIVKNISINLFISVGSPLIEI